ncbi:MAG TPA: hypothetical protein VNE18_05115 [Rhodanobacter sp.]|nr:hypothetical protein [Rhodanobacter sp.]
MADDPTNNPGASLEAVQAQLAAARAELDNAKSRITELNNEAKGHRLNSDKYRTEAEKAQQDRDAAIAEAAKKLSEAEAAHVAAVKAAETKASEMTTAAQKRVLHAELRSAAKDAGALDIADVIALLDMTKVKVDDTGEPANAAEVLAEMKKAKPHLFGAASTTSNPKLPPKPTDTPKSAKEMTPQEYRAARNKIRSGIRLT